MKSKPAIHLILDSRVLYINHAYAPEHLLKIYIRPSIYQSFLCFGVYRASNGIANANTIRGVYML